MRDSGAAGGLRARLIAWILEMRGTDEEYARYALQQYGAMLPWMRLNAGVREAMNAMRDVRQGAASAWDSDHGGRRGLGDRAEVCGEATAQAGQAEDAGAIVSASRTFVGRMSDRNVSTANSAGE